MFRHTQLLDVVTLHFPLGPIRDRTAYSIGKAAGGNKVLKKRCI